MDLRSSAIALILLIGATVGCYNPHIAQGGLSCTDASGCPESYRCVAGRCYNGDAGPDVPGPPMCNSATPNAPTCVADPATSAPCSPACQSGCSCGWCAVDNGAVTCLKGTTPGTKNVGDICDPKNNQDCAPGLFCFAECKTGRCYKYCDAAHKDDDCAALGTSCAVNAVSGSNYRFTLCRIPAKACDAASGSGCPGPFACYPVGKTTECDCAGTGTTGTTCGGVEGCAPGYTCLTLGVTGTTCQKTCRNPTDCPLLTCSNPGNLMYGYCGSL